MSKNVVSEFIGDFYDLYPCVLQATLQDIFEGSIQFLVSKPLLGSFGLGRISE